MAGWKQWAGIGLTIGAFALGGCDRAPASDPEKPSFLEFDQLDLKEGRGVYTATRGQDQIVIPFDIDTTKIDPARRHDSERVGGTQDGVVVLLDRYASKARADGRCADGVESMARVFSLQTRRELMAAPVESCLDGLPALADSVAWIAPNGFRVRESNYTIVNHRVAPLDSNRKE